MRFFISLGLIVCAGLQMGAAAAPAPVSDARPAAKALEELKGEDWSMLPISEKQRFVYTAIGGLERQGVFISRHPQEYLEAIEKVLASDPSMKQEFLDNVFVFLVYDAEPQARDEIDAIRAAALLPEGK